MVEACKRQCVREMPVVALPTSPAVVTMPVALPVVTLPAPVAAVTTVPAAALAPAVCTTTTALPISTWPLEMPVLALSGAVRCKITINSIETRVCEMKLMIEQRTGIPQSEQELFLDGCRSVLQDGCRLCHYADALYTGGKNLQLVRKDPGTPVLDRATLRRLRKELRNIEVAQDVPAGCKLSPAQGSLDECPLRWRATIEGPAEGPYAGGHFALDITIPADYPYRPPRVVFTTSIFHPSVASTGSIDLPVLHERWSPAITLAAIVGLVRREMEAPYAHPSGLELCPDCGNREAALLSHDREAFDRRAREETQAHARPPAPEPQQPVHPADDA
eukprot:TRINITY_DN14524_c0_g2_i1.p1 TRINITY_DN14524_c0_g2~~TRINITY_DN14524_c0_g2_i1.p1  ORF type:complete len:333 (-),score=50.42 TRINITY_DN14524_c0_g2_i1:33-1031(-)